MADKNIQILDISVDTKEPEVGSFEVLKHVRPEWEKADIAIEVSKLNSLGITIFTFMPGGGGEIAQSLASLSTKRAIQVRARLDPLGIERWNSVTVLLTCSHQCRRLVKKGRPCAIMSV